MAMQQMEKPRKPNASKVARKITFVDAATTMMEDVTLVGEMLTTVKHTVKKNEKITNNKKKEEEEEEMVLVSEIVYLVRLLLLISRVQFSTVQPPTAIDNLSCAAAAVKPRPPTYTFR